MFSNSDLIKIIKEVALEQTYQVVDEGNSKFIYLANWHGVAFEIKENSSGYLQVHQWEENEKYGRAVYSLRSVSDVIHFCSILISSSNIRAKRQS